METLVGLLGILLEASFVPFLLGILEDVYAAFRNQESAKIVQKDAKSENNRACFCRSASIDCLLNDRGLLGASWSLGRHLRRLGAKMAPRLSR